MSQNLMEENMMTGNQTVDLARLLDERTIVRLVTTLAHAQDDRDAVTYQSCFDDEVLMTHGLATEGKPWRVSASDWTQFAMRLFTHHQLFNHKVDVAGDEATCQMDVSALHQIKTPEGVASGTVGGRYFLKLRRRGMSWRIFERSLDVRYRTGDPAVLQVFQEPA